MSVPSLSWETIVFIFIRKVEGDKGVILFAPLATGREICMAPSACHVASQYSLFSSISSQKRSTVCLSCSSSPAATSGGFHYLNQRKIQLENDAKTGVSAPYSSGMYW